MMSILERYAPMIPPYELMDETAEFPDETSGLDEDGSGDNHGYPTLNSGRINTHPAVPTPPGA
jgi:hypothetical protein